MRLLASRWPQGDGRELLAGVGDDCAVLCKRAAYWLFKTDAVVEGVHFLRDAPPRLIGRKALARALSDLAAMGGKPWAALVTLGTPSDESSRRLRRIYEGMEALARKHQVILAGGETTRSPVLILSISMIGTAKRPVLRSTAASGDILWVTGRLGGAQRRHHLAFEPRLPEGQWLAEGKWATSMMDLSDGLAADLPRLCEASKVAAAIEVASLPIRRGCSPEQAMSDGEDYELLFTTSPARGAKLLQAWPFRTTVTRIGILRPLTRMRESTPEAHGGFDHFH